MCDDQLVVVTTEVAGDAVVVHVTGEVDMTTVGQVRAELDRVIADGPPVVVVDLTGVSFFASSGLQLLVDVRDAARARPVELLLVARSRVVLRPMEITGILVGFPMFSSVALALAGRSRDAQSSGELA